MGKPLIVVLQEKHSDARPYYIVINKDFETIQKATQWLIEEIRGSRLGLQYSYFVGSFVTCLKGKEEIVIEEQPLGTTGTEEVSALVSPLRVGDPEPVARNTEPSTPSEDPVVVPLITFPKIERMLDGGSVAEKINFFTGAPVPDFVIPEGNTSEEVEKTLGVSDPSDTIKPDFSW